MTEIRHQVNDLLQEGWEVYTVDEVRVEHEAETRRMWLPRGRRTKLYVDREKASQSFFGALSLTTRKMRIYPIEGNQNTEQTILMTGPPPTRDRRGKEDRRRPGQRQVPPRQGPDRPLRPRPGPGTHNTHLPATLRPRPQSHGTRVERRQEQHRQPPTRHPGENLHGLHHLHHQPHLRLRPRAPPNHTTTHRSCLIPAINSLKHELQNRPKDVQKSIGHEQPPFLAHQVLEPLGRLNDHLPRVGTEGRAGDDVVHDTNTFTPHR